MVSKEFVIDLLTVIFVIAESIFCVINSVMLVDIIANILESSSIQSLAYFILYSNIFWFIYPVTKLFILSNILVLSLIHI